MRRKGRKGESIVKGWTGGQNRIAYGRGERGGDGRVGEGRWQGRVRQVRG